LQKIGASPPGQVDIVDMAAVIAHLGHRFVEVVAHQYRERQVQYEQQQDEGGDKPQG